ncbi:MAG: phosphoglycerate kinase [Euryarchaeota archaeon]|nr:phosphoglycerate kinase [Euryarchaeota archaeon]
MKLRSLDHVDVKGKTVLVRVDYNVPLDVEAGHVRVSDDKRIRASLSTINHLRAERCRVVLVSHLGRPKGPSPELSLEPVAERLGKLLKTEVHFVHSCIGEEAEKAAAGLEPGGVLLLENVRFHAEEKQNDPGFAKALAKVVGKEGFYVNDAFGTAHRAHASTRGVADHLPGAVGFLIEDEVERLSKVMRRPERPFVLVLGGAKVSDKILLIENLLPKVDRILIGGGMAFTFLKALGHETGKSLLEADRVEAAKTLLLRAKAEEVDIVLPEDFVVAAGLRPDADTKVVESRAIPADRMGLDIGPRTAQIFTRHLQQARTILLNGPMGVFEMDAFAQGTAQVVHTMASAEAYTLVGGGDSAAAVERFGMTDQMDHVSTGGGASLEFLEGKVLPGLEPFLVTQDATA